MDYFSVKESNCCLNGGVRFGFRSLSPVDRNLRLSDPFYNILRSVNFAFMTVTYIYNDIYSGSVRALSIAMCGRTTA